MAPGAWVPRSYVEFSARASELRSKSEPTLFAKSRDGLAQTWMDRMVARGRRVDGEVTDKACAAKSAGCGGNRLSGGDLCGECIAGLLPDMLRNARDSGDWRRCVKFARLRLKESACAGRVLERWSR